MAASDEEKVVEKTQGQGVRKSALKAGSPGAAAVGGSPGGSPVAERVSKVPRVGDGVLPPGVDFPFRGGGSSPGTDGGVPAGSAASPPRVLSLRR